MSLLWNCCGHGRGKDMPLKDELVLTSWEKFRLHRRFPYKLVVDVVSMVVCVAMVILLAAQTSSYSLNSNGTFQQFFNLGNGPKNQIFDTAQFVEASSMFVKNYWSMSNLSLARFGHFRQPDSSEPVDPVLILTRYKSSFWNDTTGVFSTSQSRETYTQVFNLTREDPLGPFTVGNSSRVVDVALLQTTKSAVISISLQSLNIGPLGALAYRWTVTGSFEFVAGSGSCNYRLRTSKSIVADQASASNFSTHFGISAFLFVWSLGALVLSIRAMIRDLRNYLLVKGLYSSLSPVSIAKYTEAFDSWSSLPWEMKANFFHFWHIWNSVGCILIIISCCISFAVSGSSATLDLEYNIILGMGTFFSCVNITRYFELNRSFSVLINTLRLSFRRVLIYTVSVLPIFAGYLLLGVACFSNFSERFSSMDFVAVALFSTANGDEIHATFNELADSFPVLWFTRVYMYTFLLLFISAIMNIGIFVIEEAFSVSKSWDLEKSQEQAQRFSLVNLISILELEGKQLSRDAKAHPGWQMLDPTGSKDSFGDLDVDEPLIQVEEQPAEGGETPPPWLRRSITSSINMERRKRAIRKDKEEEEDGAANLEREDASAAIDAAFLEMQKQMKAQLDALKRELRVKK